MPVWAKYILWGIGALIAIKYVLPKLSRIVGFVAGAIGIVKQVPVTTNEGKIDNQINSDPDKYKQVDGSILTAAQVTADALKIWDAFEYDVAWYSFDALFAETDIAWNVMQNYTAKTFSLLADQYAHLKSDYYGPGRKLVEDINKVMDSSQIQTLQHLWV